MKKLIVLGALVVMVVGLVAGWGAIREVAAQVADYFYSDPDAGPFDPGVSREEFLTKRAEAIALKRGVEKDKPFDPQLRIDAIKEMQTQEKSRFELSSSPIKDNFLAAWTEIGPNPIPNGQTSPSTAVSGRVTAIDVHPTNPSIAFVGTAQGGLYRTLDGGSTWTPLMDNAASMAIGSVTIDPTDPTIVFVGTGEGNLSLDSFNGVGLYRINNALSGSPIVNGPFQSRTNGGSGNAFINSSITKIVVDPTNNNNIFVSNTFGFGGISGSQNPAASGFPGLYYCGNAQAATPTFVRVTTLPGGGVAGVSDIVMEPGNPNTLVVGEQDFSGGSPNSGIYLSTNALSGAGLTSTWTKTLDLAGTQNNIKLAVNKIAATVTVLAATAEANGTLRRSTDGGATWSSALASATGFCGGQCFYDIAVAIDPADSTKIYLAGNVDSAPAKLLARSFDSGVSFQAIDPGLHADSHAFVLAPSNTAIAYFGNDGGIWRSDNVNTATPGSVAWFDGNTATFKATQFWSIAVHPTDPNFSIGGTQDNGTNFYQPGATWTRADFGDGGYSLIDQNATDTTNVRMYHTYFNNNTLNGYATVANTALASDGNWTFRGCSGATGNNITCTSTVLFYAPIEQGPGNPNTIYYGSNKLYRSSDTGSTHTTVSQTFANPISAIGISPQDDNVRIIGTSSGQILGTTTGSTSLTDLDTGGAIPNNYVARAVIDPNNVNTAYVTLSAFGVSNVWRTTNFSSPTPTWTALPGTGGNILPLVPVSAFLVDPANSAILYAGTDIGVYVSIDSGANWTPFGTGLPRVAVFDIAKTSGNLIRIATHGRGLWQTAAITAAGATHFTVSAPASATAGSAFSYTVTALDASNAVVPGYTGTVHFTSSDGAAILPADYTFVVGDAGVHTFTSLATLKTAGNQTITATDTVTAAITGTSSTIAVSPATAATYAVSAPASATAGTAFSFTVTARDNFNNVATGYPGTVHFTSTDGAATLPANYTFVGGDAGVHTFSATLKTAGTQTITGTDTVTAAITGTSNTISVAAAAATHFTVSAPASATPGAAFNFTVTAQDQFNNTATGYAGTVHFTSSDGAASLPANSTLASGTGTFSATLNTPGSRTITATDTVTAAITGTSNTINVSATAATHFAVSAPASATAGSAFSYTVTALDATNAVATGYTGTVHFTTTDGAAVLPVDYVFVGGDAGAHTFSATLKTAGNQTITGTDTVTGSITGTSGPISVAAAATNHFTVTAPGSATAGTSFNFTVTARDQFNNTTTGYTGTAHFTSSDGAAVLPANYTFVVGDSGVHTFSATLKTAGNQTITGTDTVTPATTGTSNTISVAAAAATHFTVSAPASATAGTSFNFTITALDQFNNTATTYGGTVHFTSTDGAAVLPANSTLTLGTGTFSATLKTAGNQTITGTDTVTAAITGTSNTISVAAAAATHFAVSAPGSATAGTSFNFTITALDQFNNTATGYAGIVHFTSTDGAAVLPANSTLASGTGTFSATLKTAGNQTITGTDTVTAAITGTSNTINVAAAAATHFTVSAPASATPGAAFNFTVTAQDQFNNTATGYAGTVHFTSSDGAASLPANSTLASGTGTFSATLNTGGPQTITATDTVTAAITGTSNTITVTVNSADLGITMTDGVTTATPGGSVTYTITASNAGPAAATGATVADTLPASLTATWTCVGAGGGSCIVSSGSGNINNTVNLPAGGSVTYTVTATISAAATGTLSNTATVTPPAGITDPTPANNSATDTDTLTPSADLAITKTDGVTTATAGGSVTYTITASNAGPSNAPGATVADTFPASLTGTWTCVGAGGGTCTASGSGNINNTVNLPAGGSVTYTVSATVSPSAIGPLSNTATVTPPAGVTDPTPGNNSATDTDTIVITPDLAITKTDGSSSYTPGGPITYTIVVKNNGPSNATLATVTDAVPAAITGVTYNCVASGTAACGTNGSAGSTLSFTNVSVPVGAANFVTYTASGTVAPATTGNLSNTATVAAGAGQTDTTPGNNAATDIDAQNSTDLSITKTDSVLTTPAGSTVTYTIVATNPGPLAAPGSTVTDLLPPTVIGATWTCTGTGGATCGVAAGVGSINQTVNLPASSTVIYTVTATTSPNATGTLTNTATVAPPVGSVDLNPTNNSATDTDTLTAPSTFVIDDVTKAEGQSGTTAFVFTVSKLGGTGFATAVQYQTSDGTATVAGSDYQATSGTLSFGPFETSKQITVLVNGDTVIEPNETFTVHLLGGANALIGDADGLGTIINDDPGVAPTPTPTPPNRFEGDINRTAVGVGGTGDGDVNVADQIQYQRFLSGADCPSTNEQPRLDAGPIATKGDGLLGSADGTAIDAYARHDASTDFDPNTPGWQPTPVGGPTAITNLGCTPSSAPERAAKATAEPKAASAARVVRMVSRPGVRGSDITVEIEMAAQGNEAGTQYSFHFDPAVLSISDISGVDANPDITRGADAPAGTTLNVNAADAANGNIGIVENFSGASTSIRAIPAGETRIAKLKFHVLDGGAAGTSRVDFDNSVVSGVTSDTNGMVLSANYEGGSISIASAAGVSVSGRVTSFDGRGIRNATVRITGQDGVSHSVSTSSFGYYTFDDVVPGESYVISVSVRQYRFATRRVDITDSLADLDFVGQD